MDFDRLDMILRQKHMSRRALALAVGIKESTMSTAFMRRSGFSHEDVVKIAEYLGINPYYLEGWTDNREPEAVVNVHVKGDNFEVLERLRGYAQLEMDNESRQRLNAAFDKLNATGQHEAVKRVEELTEIPRYTGTDGEQ